MADKVVPYAGGQGEGGMLPPIAAWVDWWTQRNNCTAAIQQVTYNGVVRHVSWTCGGQDGIVQHYEVESLGMCGDILLPFAFSLIFFSSWRRTHN